MEQVRSGRIPGKKMLILGLNDKDEQYALNIRNAGMFCSEILSLLEVTRVEILREMGYL